MEELAGYDFRGVLVHFWKEGGRTGDEMEGRIKR
jgi:hypothetical protein